MLTKTPPRERAKPLIDRSIRKAIAKRHGKGRKIFLAMLAEVQLRSELLRPSRFPGRVDQAWLDLILQGLLALAEHRRDWCRPLECWTPTETNPIPLFSSLAHHLLAGYPVPPVLLSAWFLENGSRQQHWFKQAGRGMSLREITFPIKLNRRMAHLFAHAPVHFPIAFALRWAHVIGLGGSDALARAVASTRLAYTFHEREFWNSLIHFLINHPKIELELVEPIVEFLYDRKFEHKPVIVGEDSQVHLDPPEPDLSIKGWTELTMRRRLEEWRASRKVEVKRVLIRWDPSSIGGFLGLDDEGRTWTIGEILDSDALAAEGKAMKHCVAEYTAACERRISTIWSVRIQGPGGPERAATVEVDPASREVVQARSKCNADPNEECLAMLKRWADSQSITIPVESD